MDDNRVQGWTAPVYQGVSEPLLIGGVPPLFLVLDFLGTLLLAMLWWRGLFLGLGLYVCGVALTAWEPRWWSLLRAYRRYCRYYEG